MHHLVHRIASSVIRSAPINYIGRHGMITFRDSAFYIHDGHTPGGIAVTGTAAGFATENYVDTAINDLINGAPGVLDTLNELSAALGNDPDYAVTLVNALALKADKASLDTYIASNDAEVALKAYQVDLDTHITNTNNALALKADQVDLNTHINNTTASLALKADQISLDTYIISNNAALALKANQTSLDTYITSNDAALALKANQTSLDTHITNTTNALALKADQTSLDTYITSNDAALALKADQTSLDTYITNNNNALALKADQITLDNFITDVNSALALKANQSSLDSFITSTNNTLALKANQSSLDSFVTSTNNALALKANQTSLDSFITSTNNALALKADQTSLEAHITNTTNALALKADQSSLDSFITSTNNTLSLKANAADVYTKTESNNNFLDVAGDTMTGRLVLSSGAAGGLAFPENAFGGGSDTATITLVTVGGENTRMTFTMTNDDGDKFNFVAPSNNGLLMNDNTVWHAGNDGAGSGLDADLLDGLDSSYFRHRYTAIVRKGTWSRLAALAPINLFGSVMITIQHTRANVVVGNTFMVTFGHSNHGQITQLGSHGYTQVEVRLAAIDSNSVYFEIFEDGPVGGDYEYTVTLDNICCTYTDYTVFTDGSASTTIRSQLNTMNNEIIIDGNKVWHAGNDGAGSSLDADLLDGNHAADFALAGHTHPYLPLVGGELSGALTVNSGSANKTKLYSVDDNSWFEMIKNDGTVVGRMGFDGYSDQSALYTDFVLKLRGQSDADLTTVMSVSSLRAIALAGTGLTYNGNDVLTTASNISSLQVTNALGYTPASTAGGTITNDWSWTTTGLGLNWAMNTDGASIKFYNAGDGDSNSRLEFETKDNGNEFFRWSHTSGGTNFEAMRLVPNTSGNSVLTVSGEVRAQSEVTAYYSSDRNLKENIAPIENALEKLKSITGVMFDWKDEYLESRGGEDDYYVRKHDTGVIAQDVESVLPEVVAIKQDGYKAVRYEKLAGLIIEAIKELSEQVEDIKNRLK